MELFLLYFWLKLDTISNAFLIAGVLTIILIFKRVIMNKDIREPKDIVFTRSDTIWALLAFSFFLTSNLLPSKKDMAILIGAHYAIKVASTPEADKAFALLRQKVNEVLDEELSKVGKKR